MIYVIHFQPRKMTAAKNKWKPAEILGHGSIAQYFSYARMRNGSHCSPSHYACPIC